MVATNSIAQRTGNISCGTSVFLMVVLEKALSRLHTEVDMGYEAKVKGDMRDGFTVTNTYVDKKLAKTGLSGSGLLLGSTILGGAGAVMLAVRRKREQA